MASEDEVHGCESGSSIVESYGSLASEEGNRGWLYNLVEQSCSVHK